MESMKSPRNCSQCGNNGHNARTCTDGAAGIMLFGVRLTTTQSSPSLSPSLSLSSSAFRKSASMNNLSQYEHHPQDSPRNAAADGYASDDALHASGSRSRDQRKRGIPWTEEEHKLFLMGLKKVGKGDWRGISRIFVKTRTPTQVASHAQKYFLRRSNVGRRRRRTSLFDITTDTVTNSAIEEESLNQDSASLSLPPPPRSPSKLDPKGTTPVPTLFLNPKQTCPAPLIPVPPSSKMANLNLNQSPASTSTSTSTTSFREKELEPFLSLKLSSAPSDEGLGSRASAFGEFNSSGDSIISVA